MFSPQTYSFAPFGLDDFPFDLPNFSSPKSIAITVLVPMTSALVTFTLGKGFHTSAFLAGLLAASQAGKLLGIAAAFKTVVDSGAFDGVPGSRTAEVYAGLGFALGPATVSCIASVVLVALLVPRWHVRYYLFIQRERRKSRAPIADKTS